MNLKNSFISSFCLAFFLGTILQSSAQDTKSKSLYERLGGIHPIAAVVDDLINRIAVNPVITANPRTVEAVKRTGPAAIKFQVTAFIANLAGGPQKYTGRTMLASHRNLGITQVEWDAFMFEAGKTLEAFKIPSDLQKELAGVLISFKNEIVIPESSMTNATMADTSALGTPKSDPKSLYIRLGGINSIAAVVDEFVNELGQDKTILANPKTVEALGSGKVSIAGIKYLLTEQLSEAAGGPQKYSGRAMKDSHSALMIGEKEWEAAGKLLKKTLDKFKVPAKEQSEVLEVVSSTKKDVVKNKKIDLTRATFKG